MVAYRLTATVKQCTIIAAQQLSAAHTYINQLAGAPKTCNNEICHLQARVGNVNMPYDFELNNRCIDT